MKHKQNYWAGYLNVPPLPHHSHNMGSHYCMYQHAEHTIKRVSPHWHMPSHLALGYALTFLQSYIARVCVLTLKPSLSHTNWVLSFWPLHSQAPVIQPSNQESYCAAVKHIISISGSKASIWRELKYASAKRHKQWQKQDFFYNCCFCICCRPSVPDNHCCSSEHAKMNVGFTLLYRSHWYLW